MNNPRLAKRYAKSVVGLAIEQGQLDLVYNDMKLILSICRSNPDFVAVLVSPIIKPTAKGKIIESITKTRVSSLTSTFLKLLVSKNREINLPEIAQAVADQCYEINNIHKVKITTALAMSEEWKSRILARVVKRFQTSNIDLETAVDESLIGGFILETEGQLIDASILSDLKDVGKLFLNNDYMYKIR